MKQQEGLAVAR